MPCVALEIHASTSAASHDTCRAPPRQPSNSSPSYKKQNSTHCPLPPAPSPPHCAAWPPGPGTCGSGTAWRRRPPPAAGSTPPHPAPALPSRCTAAQPVWKEGKGKAPSKGGLLKKSPASSWAPAPVGRPGTTPQASRPVHGTDKATETTETTQACLLQQEALVGQVAVCQAAAHGIEELQLAHEACAAGAARCTPRAARLGWRGRIRAWQQRRQSAGSGKRQVCLQRPPRPPALGAAAGYRCCSAASAACGSSPGLRAIWHASATAALRDTPCAQWMSTLLPPPPPPVPPAPNAPAWLPSRAAMTNATAAGRCCSRLASSASATSTQCRCRPSS